MRQVRKGHKTRIAREGEVDLPAGSRDADTAGEVHLDIGKIKKHLISRETCLVYRLLQDEQETAVQRRRRVALTLSRRRDEFDQSVRQGLRGLHVDADRSKIPCIRNRSDGKSGIMRERSNDAGRPQW